MNLKNLFVRIFSEQAACLLCNRFYHPSRTDPLLGGISLCSACSSQIEWIDGPICAVCGRKLSRCNGQKEIGLQPNGAWQPRSDNVSLPNGARQSRSGNVFPVNCEDCDRRPHTYFIRNRSAVTYSPLMRDWIYAYKYRGRERLSEGLVELLHRAYLVHYHGIPFRAVTFVPLHEERLRERKFNQAEQLARQLAERVQIPLEPTLKRIQDTPKQSKQRRSERIRGLRGAFRYIGGAPKGPLLLVDDIYTTGTTLNECARVLAEHGWTEIYALTVARA